MGRRGPSPKPTAQKRAEGTRVRKDRNAVNEMAPPAGRPARPEWLDAEGRKEWDRIVPQLEAAGVLSTIDQSQLADYCASHALAVKATKRYQREGQLLKVNGQLQRHPSIKIAQEARAQKRLLAAEFGLSPAARSRISTPKSDQGLAEANARIKGAANGATAEAEATEDFLFGGGKLGAPKLVPPPAPAPVVKPAG